MADAPTEQEALRVALSSAERVLLTGPLDPDGDSIGACLALARVIRRISNTEVEVAGEASFRYAWMPGAEDMRPDHSVEADFDLVVVMDGDRRRLSPPVRAAFDAASCRAIIDHHGTTSAEGYDLAWIDHSAESTCGMVLRLMDSWGVALDLEIAQLLYAGVIFDTGGFRYSNTGAETHRQAARMLDQGIDHAAIATKVLMERRRSGMLLHARVLDTASFHGDGSVMVGVIPQALSSELCLQPGDTEGIVDSMVFVEGVEVAALLIERAPDQVKLSLRSRGLVNVAHAAKALSSAGGGHAKAAGATLFEDLSSGTARVAQDLVRFVERARG